MAKRIKKYSEEYPNGKWVTANDTGQSRSHRRQSRVIGHEVQSSRSYDIELGSDWKDSSVAVGPGEPKVTGRVLDGPCNCGVAPRRYGGRLYDRRTRRYYHGVRCPNCHCIWTKWS